MIVLVIRVAAIVVGVALFVAAELIDNRHALKPYSTGKQRGDTFFDDAKVFSLRIAAATLVLVSLISWVIANHIGAGPR